MNCRLLSLLLSVLLAAVIWQGCDDDDDHECPLCDTCATGGTGPGGSGGTGGTAGGGTGGASGAPLEITFEEAEIKIEINATDEDSGLHGFLDAKGWES